MINRVVVRLSVIQEQFCGKTYKYLYQITTVTLIRLTVGGVLKINMSYELQNQ